MPEPTYITVAEAAARLGVEHKTIRRHVASGALQRFRIGNTSLIRLSAAEVDNLVQPEAVPSPARP